MKIAITGHTQGIGLALYNYFSPNNDIIGFSKSTGYNIADSNHRQCIVDQAKNCDIFVNNAYSDFSPDAQLELLKLVHEQWQNSDKLIINISSRFTEANNAYSNAKKELDNYCLTNSRSSVYITNLKPGLTDTARVKSISGSRMSTANIIEVLNFILINKNNFRVHNISFGL
jgi:hypothetical protein